jgi:hypothetical protein
MPEAWKKSCSKTLPPLDAIFRKQLAGLFGEVDQDRSGFAKRHIGISGKGVVDEERDLRVGVHHPERIGFFARRGGD